LAFLAFCLAHGSDARALDQPVLLDKGLKALHFSLTSPDEADEPAEGAIKLSPPVFLIHKDAIRVRWRKEFSRGGYVGFEGNYDFSQHDFTPDSFPQNNRTASFGTVPPMDESSRVTFDFKAALGLALTEKSRLYLFTGASNAGLHISDNRYRREADFYLGGGIELNLSEEIRLRAEYNLSNYGNNWIRDGFAEIDTGQPSARSFLTRLLMPF